MRYGSKQWIASARIYTKILKSNKIIVTMCLFCRRKLLSHELRVHNREKGKLFSEAYKVIVNEENEWHIKPNDHKGDSSRHTRPRRKNRILEFVICTKHSTLIRGESDESPEQWGRYPHSRRIRPREKIRRGQCLHSLPLSLCCHLREKSFKFRGFLHVLNIYKWT